MGRGSGGGVSNPPFSEEACGDFSFFIGTPRPRLPPRNKGLSFGLLKGNKILALGEGGVHLGWAPWIFAISSLS